MRSNKYFGRSIVSAVRIDPSLKSNIGTCRCAPAVSGVKGDYFTGFIEDSSRSRVGLRFSVSDLILGYFLGQHRGDEVCLSVAVGAKLDSDR